MDYEKLLEEARAGKDKLEFQSLLPSLLTEESLEDPTRLRLLGNAIAYCEPNAEILVQNEKAIAKLLDSSALGLQILYNGTVNNQSFSEKLINSPSFLAKANRTKEFINLIGSIWESLEGNISQDLKIKLIKAGLVELLIYDNSLETNPEIIADFASIFKSCQQLAKESEEEDDFSSLGFEVVGNISSHNSFSVNDAKGVSEQPFTWETVALLANLTAAKSNLELILPKFPHIVELTMDLIRQEDPSDDEAEEDDEEEEDVDMQNEPPFDLGLWGPLFRNISRNKTYALKLAEVEPLNLINRLRKSPLLASTATEFACALSGQVYNHEITNMVVSEPVCEQNLKIAIVIAAFLSSTSESEITASELEWAVKNIKKMIVEALKVDQQEESWIRGTKAIAMLHVKSPQLVNKSDFEVKQIYDCGPRSDAINHNLNMIK